MMRPLLGLYLIAASLSVIASPEPPPHTGPVLNSSLPSERPAGTKLLIRRLRKGKLGAGGLALVARLDERSMSAAPDLKEKLELVDAPGLDIQTDYAFNLDAPTYQPSKVPWIYHPKDYEFVLAWTSHYQEVFGGPEGHIRVVINETFFLYKVGGPPTTKKWLRSYVVDREIDKDTEVEQAAQRNSGRTRTGSSS